MSEESGDMAGVTILAFCQLNGKMVYAEISGHTYEAMTRAVERLCFKNKAELIRAAFEKYGVSESAIERCLSEFAGRMLVKRQRKKSPGYLTCDILERILKKHGGQIQADKLYLILAQRDYLVWGAQMRDVLSSFRESNLFTYYEDRGLVVLNKKTSEKAE